MLELFGAVKGGCLNSLEQWSVANLAVQGGRDSLGESEWICLWNVVPVVDSTLARVDFFRSRGQADYGQPYVQDLRIGSTHPDYRAPRKVACSTGLLSGVSVSFAALNLERQVRVK